MVHFHGDVTSLRGDNNQTKLAQLFTHRGFLYRIESDGVSLARFHREKRNLPQFSIYRTFDYLRLWQLWSNRLDSCENWLVPARITNNNTPPNSPLGVSTNRLKIDKFFGTWLQPRFTDTCTNSTGSIFVKLEKAKLDSCWTRPSFTSILV